LRHRVVRGLRWKPSTYRQVWIFAVVGFGVPGFCIWEFVAPHSLIASLVYAVGITFFGGLGQTWRLNRRRGW
jgi:hypothetical protein